MAATEEKRKHYAGDVRVPGTKDFSLILSNLMSYKHKLEREQDEQKVGYFIIKIGEKLKELGFGNASKIVKKKAGRRKQGKFQDITEKKKQETLELALKNWEVGRAKQDEAREKQKEEKKNAK